MLFRSDKGNWVGPPPRQLGKMYESEFQEYKAQRIKVRDQYWLDFLLSEDVEVEGSTSSSDGNMLESKNSSHVTESHKQFLSDIWESDGRLDHVTIESCNLGHEGIGDDNRRSSTADRRLLTADRRPLTADCRSLNADRRTLLANSIHLF